VAAPFGCGDDEAPVLMERLGTSASPSPSRCASVSWFDDRCSFVVTVLFADAAGSAPASFPIPSGPGIVDLTLWLKGIRGFGLPLEVSPPIVVSCA